MAEKKAMSGKATRYHPATQTPTPAEGDRELKGAYIVPVEWVNKFMVVIGELPRKLSPMIDPLVEELSKCARGDIKITMSPPKQDEESK